MDHPPEPEPSAVVILRRPTGEIYLVRRPKQASFFPGFHAFPGGGVEPEDERDTELATLRACAVRELAEETGVQLDPDELDPAGVVVTPPFSPIRYRTQFFCARVEEDVDPDPREPELAGGAWMQPADVMDRWREGQLKVPPPVLRTLELVDEQGLAAITQRGTDVDTFPITFLPGVRVEALETSTLPPHTHTNAFIVGEEELAIVDPGASSPELDPLLDALEQLETEAEHVAYVVLTHHHGDHVGGVDEIVERFAPEIACSPATAKRLNLDVDVLLEDGDELRLGDMRIQALETPGHAVGHLCLHVPSAQTVLAGDLIAGIGTVLVGPEEGDMGAYIDSLHRMARFCEENDVVLGFPAHGPPIFGPAERFEDIREHRLEREERVLEAVRSGAVELAEIAKRAYEDKPEAPEQLTQASTRAHLAKLVDDGEVRVVDEGWQPA